MKKLIALFALVFAAAAGTLCASAADVTVEVNGTPIESDTDPIIVEDRTMVPLRAICEALDCDVAWDEKTQSISICKNNHLYCMWIGKDTAFDLCPAIHDSCTMDVVPMIVNDRTMIPLRAFAELFGAEVGWDGETMTASVDVDLGVSDENDGVAERIMPYVSKCFESYDVYRAYVNGTLPTKNVQIEFTDGKTIDLELYPEIAPKTVDNFIMLANEGFYDNLVFHRVIKDFMIQGGGYDSSVDTPKEAASITGEFLNNYWLNLIPHTAGTISMARSADYDSATSQFFIVHKDSRFLDGEYAAFGKVTDGMDVVDEIAETPTQTIWTGISDVPVTLPTIKTITVESVLVESDFDFVNEITTPNDIYMQLGYRDYEKTNGSNTELYYILENGTTMKITVSGNGVVKEMSVER